MKQPAGARRARLKALAKINLSLKVLHKRNDGFHELRTIFQTISLADRLDVEYLQSSNTGVQLDSNLEIAGNLVVRAARSVMEAAGITGEVTFRLRKNIPLGGGLGGGSSDAAAVLLALPALAGRPLPFDKLMEVGTELGSDVPFFLTGGTVLGVGRGTELYPLPDVPAFQGLVAFPALAVSTQEAYRGLDRELTPDFNSINMAKFQVLSWTLSRGLTAGEWATLAENDFEEFVWERYPELVTIRRRLIESGARPVMLSGSGSSLFGIFSGRRELEQALRAFEGGGERVTSFRLVSRARYRRMWWRSLREHIEGESWPPRSRYS